MLVAFLNSNTTKADRAKSNSLKTNNLITNKLITNSALTVVKYVQIFFCVLAATTSEAAPKPDLWEFWMSSAEQSTKEIDHSDWTYFLGRYVSMTDANQTGVAYGNVTPSDKTKLNTYIDRLQNIEVTTLAREEQLAYWINLYNATTVNVVIDAWPIDSIRQISSSLFNRGPWTTKLLTIEGKELSLNDIEHRILRPIWKDPRLHYALNCASIGCPDLITTAFTRNNSGDLMNKAARNFINHPRGVRFDDGKLIISSIYDWFSEDFGTTGARVLEHLKKYATGPIRELLNSVTEIADHQYDWNINAIYKQRS